MVVVLNLIGWRFAASWLAAVKLCEGLVACHLATIIISSSSIITINLIINVIVSVIIIFIIVIVVVIIIHRPSSLSSLSIVRLQGMQNRLSVTVAGYVSLSEIVSCDKVCHTVQCDRVCQTVWCDSLIYGVIGYVTAVSVTVTGCVKPGGY